MNSTIASVRNLRKRYKDVEALRGLSFDLQPGEIFGLLGPNGAGKTTTIEIMEGLRPCDGGEASVLGMDPWRQAIELKQRIGAALQETNLPDKIRVGEALALYGSFYQRRADLGALLSRFGLRDKRSATYDALSGGQKQRLALALCLVNDPDLVFLDEPTAGLDAQVRRELHDLILQLRAEGKTVLLTTHYIEEAERLCDRVAIIAHGELKALGTPAELRAQATSLCRVDAGLSTEAPDGIRERLPAAASVEIRGSVLRIRTTAPAEAVAQIVRALDNAGITLTHIAVTQPTLEDLYLELTGEEAVAA